ncbi:serpin family protein [Youngiibacter fragilis]|uniref:Serine protease n=1 Tax=Youngiibacter fragilis 232.1 TaxID=994573 RepID=V7I798_9CLOT|nr:serpin family protein [Youngiibacter fragilis]ETA82075.1 serine protease [Youngiibacter fragilis 232.1]
MKTIKDEVKSLKLHCTRSMVLKMLTVPLTLVIASGLTACTKASPTAASDDLMDGISKSAAASKTPDEVFKASYSDFSIELFRELVSGKENTLVSPLSVLMALSMTANGAAGDTLDEMEKLLGHGIPLSDLNAYLHSYSDGLPDDKKSRLRIANSIWFRDDEGRLTVEKGFLQTNADYYKAAAYKSKFDDATLEDINSWVGKNTDGMLDSILDSIHPDAVMYLINAIVFDAEWEKVYSKEHLKGGSFKSASGTTEDVEFMNSEEGLYLEDSMSTGFIKPYSKGLYSFAAILPNDGTSLDEYVGAMTGTGFLDLIQGAESTLVTAALPKFSYSYKISMNDSLKRLGMPTAFSSENADFSRLGKSSRGNLFIGDVLHKTFISVDELGTKAGAVTKVEIREESYIETKVVILDRPFIYAIIDNSTGLPIFIGTVNSVK